MTLADKIHNTRKRWAYLGDKLTEMKGGTKQNGRRNR